MGWIRAHRSGVTLGLAVASPLALAALLVALRSTVASVCVALVFVVLVAAIAIAGTRVSGALASASAALWFDFFFTRPYDSFDISGRRALEITISLAVVGLAVSELAARNRHHLRSSSEASQYLEMVRELAQLAQRTSGPELTARAETMILEVLGLRACRFDAHLADPPLARVSADGEVSHVGLRWPVESMGIPGPQSEILAQWRGRVLGRFVLTPTPGEPVSRERRGVAVTLATLCASGMTVERGPS